MSYRLALTATLACTVWLAAPISPASAADPALGRDGDFTLSIPDVEEQLPANWYVRIDAGGSHVGGGTASFGAVSRSYDGGRGWTVGIGLGYRLLPQLRADVTADYVGHNRIGENVFLANAYWDIATWGRVTPYVGAGIGAAHVSLSERAQVGMIPDLDRGDWQFAWSLMAGASWAITPDITLNAGYRFLDLGAPAFSTPGPLALTLSSIQEQQFRLGLRFALK